VNGRENIISVEIGWRNVSPDSRVGGKTPQQWLVGRALGSGFDNPLIRPVVPMEGQTCPHYSVLIARAFGRAVLVLTDKYPNSRGYHSEPYVIISPQLYEKFLSTEKQLCLTRLDGGSMQSL
jgi:hypothetical protein